MRKVRTIAILLVVVGTFWATLKAARPTPIIATYRSISRCVQDGDTTMLLTLDASGYCRIDINRAGNKNAADGTYRVNGRDYEFRLRPHAATPLQVLRCWRYHDEEKITLHHVYSNDAEYLLFPWNDEAYPESPDRTPMELLRRVE